MIDPETGMSLEFFSLGMILQRHEWAVMPRRGEPVKAELAALRAASSSR